MDEKIMKIYDESLDKQPMAHDELREAYEKLVEALEEYIIEIQKSAFGWGYEMGCKEAVTCKE